MSHLWDSSCSPALQSGAGIALSIRDGNFDFADPRPYIEQLMHALLLSDDLIFSSKVAATARAHGLTVRTVKTSAALLKEAAATPSGCVILDLQNPGLDIPWIVQTLRAQSPVRIVGYGAHVDVQTLHVARDAGCDEVLARSKFVKDLETRLPEWVTGGTEQK